LSHLSIEIGEHAIRYTESIGEETKSHIFTFGDKQDHRYKEQLEVQLEEIGLKNKSFEEQTLSWTGFRSTLIPSSVFSESKPETLYRLCFGSDTPAAHIDYNRIPEQGLVNVYEIPQWVKAFFVLKYPRIVIQHEGSHLLRGIFSGSVFRLRSILTIHNNHFLLCIVKENKLLYYSSFDYIELDDIVYHFMFTLQQKDLLQEKGSIDICPGIGFTADQANELNQKLNSLKDLKDQPASIQASLLQKAQRLCV
jgi:hypothetical protein